MDPKTTAITLTFLSLSSILVSSSNISAIFGFGDSTIDTGNNNFLLTIARSDHKPYGRDFPDKIPTGRFTNGKLPIDFLASALGLKDQVPPYLAIKRSADNELLTGVSFGSAGSGVDPLTASAINVLNLTDQINMFDEASIRIRRLVGEMRAKLIIKNGLFFLSTGSNDFTNFYRNNLRSSQFNISGYQDFVLKGFEAAIHRLYTAGGRRFGVQSLPPIGCLPIQITVGGNLLLPRRCIQRQNNDSAVFNEKLQLLASRLQSQLPDSRVAYSDSYYQLLDMINNPEKYGIKEALKGCCGTGLFELGPTCREPIKTCPDPSKYVFWDAIHPTLKVYSALAVVIQALIPSLTS